VNYTCCAGGQRLFVHVNDLLVQVNDLFVQVNDTVSLCVQVNDFVRGKTRQKDGSVPLGAEILAGGCVSLCCASMNHLCCADTETELS